MTKADKKHREQARHLWNEVFLMHYNPKRKGTQRVAYVHADAAVAAFEKRWGEVPPGQGCL